MYPTVQPPNLHLVAPLFILSMLPSGSTSASGSAAWSLRLTLICHVHCSAMVVVVVVSAGSGARIPNGFREDKRSLFRCLRFAVAEGGAPVAKT